MHQQVASVLFLRYIQHCLFIVPAAVSWSCHCQPLPAPLQRLPSWSHCFSLILTLILPLYGRPCHLPAGNPSVTSCCFRPSPRVLLASTQHYNPSPSHSLLCWLSASHTGCLSFPQTPFLLLASGPLHSLLSARVLPSALWSLTQLRYHFFSKTFPGHSSLLGFFHLLIDSQSRIIVDFLAQSESTCL